MDAASREEIFPYLSYYDKLNFTSIAPTTFNELIITRLIITNKFPSNDRNLWKGIIKLYIASPIKCSLDFCIDTLISLTTDGDFDCEEIQKLTRLKSLHHKQNYCTIQVNNFCKSLRMLKIANTTCWVENIYKLPYLKYLHSSVSRRLNFLIGLKKLDLSRFDKFHDQSDNFAIDKLTSLKELNCSSNNKIGSLNTLINIVSLNISGYHSSVGQFHFDRLSKIKYLNVSNNWLINSLNHLPDLISLDISGYFTTVTERDFISCRKIKILNCSNRREISLSHLTELEDLNMDNASIKGLDKLKKLKTLSYVMDSHEMDSPGMTTFIDLNDLTELESLNISGRFNQVTQAGIEKLFKLKILQCANNKNITSVDHLPHLIKLNIEGVCGVSLIGLNKIKKIQVLKCGNNAKIFSLNDLKELVTLDISGEYCGVEQAGIAELINLRKLKCNNNPNITSIDCFPHLILLNSDTIKIPKHFMSPDIAGFLH